MVHKMVYQSWISKIKLTQKITFILETKTLADYYLEQV